MTDRCTADALFTTLDQDALQCPAGVYAALRRQGPVAWVDQVQAYVVTGMEEAQDVLRRDEVFSSRNTGGPLASQSASRAVADLMKAGTEVADQLAEDIYLRPVLLGADGPEHHRRRTLVASAFTPSRVRALEPLVQKLCHELIDGMGRAGSVDFVEAFAVPLPVRVICHALEFPPEDVWTVKKWSDQLSTLVGRTVVGVEDLRQHASAAAEFTAYAGRRIAAARTAPNESLLSALVAASSESHQLDETEVLTMIMELLVAGNQTTTHLLCHLVGVLADVPALRRRLRGDPTQVPALVEECLRLKPPIQGFFRETIRETSIGDVAVPAGSAVFVSFAAANRDARRHSRPDVLDIDRPGRHGHLTFGHGSHFCLGASLARAEGRIAVIALLERLRDLRLEVPPDMLHWRQSFILHGPLSLPISFRAV